MSNKLSEAVSVLVEAVPDPSIGLPDEVFYYISRTTPLINVDLLIKDEKGRTLLAWRDDPFAGTGWHVPGGIIRYKETIENRIEKVAIQEIGVPVAYESEPIKISQMINPTRDLRGHFISLLYKCALLGNFEPKNLGKKSNEIGFLKWHQSSPENLIKFHQIYTPFM